MAAKLPTDVATRLEYPNLHAQANAMAAAGHISKSCGVPKETSFARAKLTNANTAMPKARNSAGTGGAGSLKTLDSGFVDDGNC